MRPEDSHQATTEAQKQPLSASGAPKLNGRSTGELVKEVAEDVSALIRMEVDLAKREVTELIRSKVRGVLLIIVGAVLALLILPLFILFSVELLAIWTPRWAATLIVTLAVAVFAAVTFLVAKKQLDSKIKPEKTIQSIKEDVAWAKTLTKNSAK